MEIIPAFGWSRNVRIANGDAELIATLDVGPRILVYRLTDGTNVLKQYDDQLGHSGEPTWMIRGGHRLWVSPEDPHVTYHPDNAPVALGEPAPGVARLTPPIESAHGLQKELDVELADSGSGVRLLHRIKNEGWSPRDIAPWALTVLAPGGTEVIPLPPARPHPGSPENARSAADYAPDRTMILWPFFDFTDDRWTFGRRFITLRQEPGRGPTKIGLSHREKAVGYLLGDTLFIKRFSEPTGVREYPDLGSNFETFTDGDMLEMETLGPIVRLPVGQMIEWEERWELVGGLPPVDMGDEESIAAILGPHLAADG